RLCHFTASGRKVSRPHQQRRILWSQSKGLAQWFGRSVPIIIEMCFDRCPREQRIGQVGFEGESSSYRITRGGKMFGEAFLASLGGIVTIPDVSLGQSRPREREFGIQLDRA